MDEPLKKTPPFDSSAQGGHESQSQSLTQHSNQGTNLLEQRERLRKKTIARRADLPKPYRLHKSAVICDELVESLDFTCAILETAPSDCTIAVYSAFEEEVQLDGFIRAAYERDMKVAFPCIVTDAWSTSDKLPQTMEMRVVSKDAYKTGEVPFLTNPLKRYTHDDGALKDFPYIPANELIMIIIPLVAFDAKRNRLGYGGGNYDRYLPQLNDVCRQIGVAFAEQEVAAIPIESHDIPVTVLAR